jgi:hypothetical protein
VFRFRRRFILQAWRSGRGHQRGLAPPTVIEPIVEFRAEKSRGILEGAGYRGDAGFAMRVVVVELWRGGM